MGALTFYNIIITKMSLYLIQHLTQSVDMAKPIKTKIQRDELFKISKLPFDLQMTSLKTQCVRMGMKKSYIVCRPYVQYTMIALFVW